MVSAKQWQTGPPLFGLHLNGLFTFGLSLDRAWSLMPRDYGCCGTEKPAKRGEVESALRLGQRPAAAAAPAAALMYRPSHNLASCGGVSG